MVPVFGHGTILSLPYSPIDMRVGYLCREYLMGTIQEHRKHAELCVAKAASADDKRDKVLWLTLAQSWAQLAEHAARINHEVLGDDATDDADPEMADGLSAPN
jgi:hypothetical protein